MVDETLAKSFERIGADYDRYRPGFPGEAAELVVPPTAAAVLDLGAGTGKFTEQLVGRAPHIVAVEPSQAMLDVLIEKLPGVDARLASAESIPLPAGSVDAVSVAQAFHWFDRDRACAEIARVLVDGGTLALIWNHADPLCAWDRAAHHVAHPAVADTDDTTDSAADHLPGFVFVDRTEIAWTERITRADYLARWSTVSTFLVADDATRTRMTAQIEEILDGDPATADAEEFDLPGVTDVFRYRRAG